MNRLKCAPEDAACDVVGFVCIEVADVWTTSAEAAAVAAASLKMDGDADGSAVMLAIFISMSSANTLANSS